MDLLKVNPATIANFPYADITSVRVVDVYDADTVTILFAHGDYIYKYKLRILGIDTPEIRSHNQLLKNHAIKARNYVKSMLPDDKLYDVKLYKWDKFGGRIIGEIFVETKSLTDILVEQSFGVKYGGATKLSDDEMIECLGL